MQWGKYSSFMPLSKGEIDSEFVFMDNCQTTLCTCCKWNIRKWRYDLYGIMCKILWPQFLQSICKARKADVLWYANIQWQNIHLKELLTGKTHILVHFFIYSHLGNILCKKDTVKCHLFKESRIMVYEWSQKLKAWHLWFKEIALLEQASDIIEIHNSCRI